MGVYEPKSVDETLYETVAQLESIVTGLCRSVDPFPAFLGMATIQAIELDPQPPAHGDLGCVVVAPDGSIAELDVTAIPGIVGVLEVDQVEQFRPLELPPDQYVVYLTEAIRALTAELSRRGI